jgi:citrate lyase subunit beta/citryl-CoA lyase
MSQKRRRSVLYVPAGNARALEKAASLPCDAVILDLEDAVAPEAKDAARIAARAAIDSGGFASKEVVVRINGFGDDGALADDLAAILPAGPDAILFPKIGLAEDAHRAELALAAQSAPEHVKLWLMIETPLAVMDIGRIAGLAAAEGARLDCLVMGTNDLAKAMRLRATPSRLALLHALSATVIAARAYGIDVLDGVFGDVKNLAGFESEALQGKGLGFDGKTLIHPAQIAVANRVFSPSLAELAEARAIIAAFEAPENAGKAVLLVDGQMVEHLHYEMARRVLAPA